MMPDSDLPRFRATFRPQVAYRDQVVNLEGHTVEFDATVALLSMTVAQLRRFETNNYDSDDLADDLPERQEHDGPFEVDCDDLNEFFAYHGLPREILTGQQLQLLRAKYGVSPRQQKPAIAPHRVLRQLEAVTTAGTSPESCREAIQAAVQCHATLAAAIMRVAQTHVPDFHFLNHALPKSWFWDCPVSPIGICVYPIDSRGHCNYDDCIYCHDPEERK